MGPHLFLLMVSAPFRRSLVLGSVKIGQAWTCAWNCGSSLFYQHTFETGRIYPASYSRINLEETAEEVPTWAAANTQGFWPPNKCSFLCLGEVIHVARFLSGCGFVSAGCPRFATEPPFGLRGTTQQTSTSHSSKGQCAAAFSIGDQRVLISGPGFLPACQQASLGPQPTLLGIRQPIPRSSPFSKDCDSWRLGCLATASSGHATLSSATF